MTTIIDPAGTPQVVFGDPSVAISAIAAAGSDESGETIIPRYSAQTVVTVTASDNLQGVKLSTPEEGDTVEIWSITENPGNPPLTYSLRLYDVGGSTINSSFRRLQLRYVAGEWRYRENG